MFEGLDLGLGFLGGSWRKGNCGALGWKGFSSLGEQGFDILGFSIVGELVSVLECSYVVIVMVWCWSLETMFQGSYEQKVLNSWCGLSLEVTQHYC